MREVRKKMTSGSTAYPRVKTRRDTSMPPKRVHRRRRVDDGPARPVWHGESSIASIPISSGPRRDSPITTSMAGSPISRGVTDGLGTLPVGERRSVRAFKGMNGTPKPYSDVSWIRNSGSPVGREPQGDGAPVRVGGRESRPHGEGGQVDRSVREPGRRDAVGVVRRSSYPTVMVAHPPDLLRIRPLESRMRGNSHVRFGGGRMEKEPKGHL